MSLIFFASALLLIPAGAPPDRIDRRLPVDECRTDPDFVDFRDRLLATIARRDGDELLRMMAEDVFVDFGGHVGRADFVSVWRPHSPESPVWDELAGVLRLGCAREAADLYWSPSLYLQLDDHPDPFGAMLAVEPGAALHSAPDPDSPIVARLEWDVLDFEKQIPPGDWSRVSRSDGLSGFVRSDQVRARLDYRAGFQKIDGRWRIAFFVAGD